jgi:hypothetical protein
MRRGPFQHLIRAVHRQYLRRPLPRKLSIYLHLTAGYENQLGEVLSFLKERGYDFVDPINF